MSTVEDRWASTWRVVRWIAVLPAAFAAAGVAYFFVLIVGWLGMMFDFGVGRNSLGIFLVRCMASGYCGASFVWVGGVIAPAARRRTAIALAVLLIGAAAPFLIYPSGWPQAVYALIILACGGGVAARWYPDGSPPFLFD